MPEQHSIAIKPRHARFPLSVRLRGSSDLDVFDQIFLAHEYACALDLIAPGIIMDLGANVGYASAYFLSHFRSAKLIAVEPDPSNFEYCVANLRPYGSRAEVLQGAVWSHRSTLELSRGTFGDGREWASEVHEQKPGALPNIKVEAWDIPGLMQRADCTQVDLLKIDIEGSEAQLFGTNTDAWLPKVANICIELHGKHCSDVFFDALRDYSYELSRSGELTVCRNLRICK